jgi:hypothetical protein
MHLIALLLRLLLLLYFPFLGLLWLGIVATEYFLGVNGLYVFQPILFLMILLVIPLLHIPWACRCLFWGTPEDEMETRLPRRKMKRLVHLVRGVARELDLLEPDVVRFHAESVAHVYINGDKEKILVELIDDWDTLESRLTGRLLPLLHEGFQLDQDRRIVEEHLRGRE